MAFLATNDVEFGADIAKGLAWAHDPSNHMAVLVARTDDGLNIVDIASWGAWIAQPDLFAFHVIVPAVRIELDPESAIDAHPDVTPGVLIRRDRDLGVAARLNSQINGRVIRVTLQGDHPPVTPGGTVGFTRWRIVIGSGDNFKVLRAIDVTAPT